MKHLLAVAALAGSLAVAGNARAADLHATMHLATPTGPGAEIGTITISQVPSGAMFVTDLKGLPPGPHGFHVHENGSCAPGTTNGQPVAAGGAGGHLDPAKTGHHEGPRGHGHLGDLPVLQVAKDGTAKEHVIAPAIKDITQLRGHALMIHAGGDNYSDTPAPLGGGGGRIACGVIE